MLLTCYMKFIVLILVERILNSSTMNAIYHQAKHEVLPMSISNENDKFFSVQVSSEQIKPVRHVGVRRILVAPWRLPSICWDAWTFSLRNLKSDISKSNSRSGTFRSSFFSTTSLRTASGRTESSVFGIMCRILRMRLFRTALLGKPLYRNAIHNIFAVLASVHCSRRHSSSRNRKKAT